MIESRPHRQNPAMVREIAYAISALGGSDEKDSDRCVAHWGKRGLC
jgi:hypothetical protein